MSDDELSAIEARIWRTAVTVDDPVGHGYLSQETRDALALLDYVKRLRKTLGAGADRGEG
jgi:hypothetical protein